MIWRLHVSKLVCQGVFNIQHSVLTLNKSVLREGFIIRVDLQGGSSKEEHLYTEDKH